MREEVIYEIFIDIHKVYDALDHDRCLNILTGHGVVPRENFLLMNYWERLTMVAKVGDYHPPPLHSFQGGDTGRPPIPYDL